MARVPWKGLCAGQEVGAEAAILVNAHPSAWGDDGLMQTIPGKARRQLTGPGQPTSFTYCFCVLVTLCLVVPSPQPVTSICSLESHPGLQGVCSLFPQLLHPPEAQTPPEPHADFWERAPALFLIWAPQSGGVYEKPVLVS